MRSAKAVFRCTGRWLPVPLWCALLVGCTSEAVVEVESQSVQRGRLLLEQYDCGRCHVVPGVRRAQGLMGPSLEAFARRAYIAGELPNQPAVLTPWIQNPPSLVPDTLMPNQQVPAVHARDMAAYLMDLR